MQGVTALDRTPEPFAALRGFREWLHGAMRRRKDALFELTDTVLTVGNIPSPPHLSLAAVHRRVWGSLEAEVL